METQMKSSTVNLNVYIVDKDWRLCRVINSSCTFYPDASIPAIEITDSMLRKLINREVLYFYDPRCARYNFYFNDLAVLREDVLPKNAAITIELLEVGDEYVILSPGLWRNTPDSRYRICDDGYLYRVLDFMEPETLSGDNFKEKFFEIYDRLYGSPEEATEETSDDVVTESTSENDDSNECASEVTTI